VPKLPAKAALALAIALGCTVAPAPARTGTTFVIPTELPNGRVEITIAPAYALGSTVTIPVAIVATRGSIAGPVTARVMASGVNEGGAPAEVLVRELAVTTVIATAGSRRSTAISWDTRDAKGQIVPADAYSLVLEVRSDDGGVGRTVTAGATLELR
jgi:hypothetical protein